ncbi:hypothetical protein [Prochlorococcus marinus]|uniref:hypothetical protein n=1 Tax=Prochlorococcus marinus TaxID=1219 RepID=UPI0022B41A89|nr:hypothetical protein [Prochlorococcus marinus]
MNRWIKKGIGLALVTFTGVIGTVYLRNAQFIMPSEYKEIKSLVNELAEHNDLGDREITFTVVPGSWVGWFAENLKLCKEDSCGFYDELNPYKKFKGDKAYEINEAIRQAYLFDAVQGRSHSHGTITLNRSSFRIFNSRREYLGCLIAHELVHFLEDHVFEDDKYVSENKKGLSEAKIEELENKRSRASEIEAHNNASLMMNNAGYPIDSCLEELKFTARLSGHGANTELGDSHPGYEEWISELEDFIASQKDTPIVNTSKTAIRWRYDRDLNVLTLIPTEP